MEIKSSVFDLSSGNITINQSGLTIYGGNFEVKNKKNESKLYFDSSDGELAINGRINATSGKIGGWSIDNNGNLVSKEEASGQYRYSYELKLNSRVDTEGRSGLVFLVNNIDYFSLEPDRMSSSWGNKYRSGKVRLGNYRIEPEPEISRTNTVRHVFEMGGGNEIYFYMDSQGVLFIYNSRLGTNCSIG